MELTLLILHRLQMSFEWLKSAVFGVNRGEGVVQTTFFRRGDKGGADNLFSQRGQG